MKLGDRVFYIESTWTTSGTLLSVRIKEGDLINFDEETAILDVGGWWNTVKLVRVKRASLSTDYADLCSRIVGKDEYENRPRSYMYY